jgi:uncharacterized protein YoxC
MDWMILVYGSVLIIAVAFAVLVYFAIRTLRALESTMTNVSTVIVDVEKQLSGVSHELTSILNKTNKAADEIQKKTMALKKVSTLYHEIVEDVIKIQQQFKSFTESVSNNFQMHNDGIAKVLKISDSVFRFIEKWKERKQ